MVMVAPMSKHIAENFGRNDGVQTAAKLLHAASHLCCDDDDAGVRSGARDVARYVIASDLPHHRHNHNSSLHAMHAIATPCRGIVAAPAVGEAQRLLHPVLRSRSQ